MPNIHPTPHPRVAILSLDVRCFLPSWTLAIRCSCGRERTVLLDEVGRISLGELEERTVGAVVRRLRCQDCGKRPASVVASWQADGERVELVEATAIQRRLA